MNRVAYMINIILYAIILSWVLRIQRECNCSEDWRREYIKYYTMAIIGIDALIIAGMSIKNKFLIGTLLGAGLLNIYSVLTYVPDLSKRACVCARENDWRDDFVYWLNVFASVLFVFMLLAAANQRF